MPILIPRTCKCVNLRGKEVFAGVIEDFDLRNRWGPLQVERKEVRVRENLKVPQADRGLFNKEATGQERRGAIGTPKQGRGSPLGPPERTQLCQPP